MSEPINLAELQQALEQDYYGDSYWGGRLLPLIEAVRATQQTNKPLENTDCDCDTCQAQRRTDQALARFDFGQETF